MAKNFAVLYLDGLQLFLVEDARLDPVEVDGSGHLINLAFDETLGQALHHLNNRIIKGQTKMSKIRLGATFLSFFFVLLSPPFCPPTKQGRNLKLPSTF